MEKVCVLGAGSWGSALAMVLAENGHDTLVWTHRAEQAEEINRMHTNKNIYLKRSCQQIYMLRVILQRQQHMLKQSL